MPQRGSVQNVQLGVHEEPPKGLGIVHAVDAGAARAGAEGGGGDGYSLDHQ